MKRKYCVKEFFDIVNLVKSIDSKVEIGTEVICGFPEESDEDFEQTYENIKNSELSFLHVLTYSPRLQATVVLRKSLPLELR